MSGDRARLLAAGLALALAIGAAAAAPHVAGGGFARPGAPLPRAPDEAAPESADAHAPGAADRAAAVPPALDRELSRCREDAPERRRACYEAALSGPAREGRVETAMAGLRAAAAADRAVERDGHVYAHAIGKLAYRARPDLAATFGRCDESFQSGCYHGVIQAYFEAHPAVDAEAVDAVCRPYRAEGASRWLLFQCVHGLGHGLTALRGHDLPRALRDCDLLRDGWDRESCYGGAFMENVVNAMGPHHGGAAGEGHGGATAGEHGGTDGEGHGIGAAAGEGNDGARATGAGRASAFQALDPADLHHPCSAVEERYLAACYGMQTSVMLFLNGGDLEGAARACNDAPPAMRSVCAQSLGRDISSYTLQDPAESIRFCGFTAERWRPWCYVGLAKNFVDLTATTDAAFAFCGSVPEEPGRLKCHEAVGEEIGILAADPAERERMCADSDPRYRAACRFGARLTQTAPAGLPTTGDA
jgi:hypothetical protein